MKAIKNGKICLEGAIVLDKVLLYEDKVVDIVDEKELKNYAVEEVIDAKGEYVLPGFIDVHIHGYKGLDTMDGGVQNFQTISKGIAANGVTAFLPTTMTMGEDVIRKALEDIKVCMKEGTDGAEIVGVHLEGPFINKDYKGAQSEKYIIVPKQELLDDYRAMIKKVTIAPEVEGAFEMIEHNKKDMQFSIGHTGATYKIAMEAIEKGATSTTHTFNAMTPLHHREPGVVGAAFISDVYCELIADNIHVNKDLYKLMLKVKGLDKILLITDCMMAGGLEDGKYELGGQVVYAKEGKCVLENGTIAGSALKLNDGLRHFMESTGLPIEKAIKLVTENPAKHIGIYDKKGSLAKGKDADIVIADKDLHIINTIVKGNLVYEM